ncbi:hypothetical protein KR222_009425 [Zaprionus bogoriensis]|nr:hypothetical protein KR222_009425 [Zaprionus bogoriensis]
MDIVLNAYRNATKFLRPQGIAFVSSPKFFSRRLYAHRDRVRRLNFLRILHKQLRFLKSRAVDERKLIDSKIAKLQERIELIKEKLRQSAEKDAKKRFEPKRRPT